MNLGEKIKFQHRTDRRVCRFEQRLGVEKLLNSYRDHEYKDHRMGHNLNERRMRMNLICSRR